jgi:hypothetical protein
LGQLFAGQRDLQGKAGIRMGVHGSRATCARFCAGFRYMGMQEFDECYCGNEYGSQGVDTDDKCGYNGRFCGIIVPPPPPPPSPTFSSILDATGAVLTGGNGVDAPTVMTRGWFHHGDGFFGSGFVNLLAMADQTITFTATVPVSGTYTLSVGYAAADTGDFERTLELSVNGEVTAVSSSYESLPFTATVAVGDGPFAAGTALTVDFTGATDAVDWIGLYLVGQAPSDVDSHDWSYHGSATDSGSVSVTPRAAGEYYVVMLCCDGYTEVSERVVITIGEGEVCGKLAQIVGQLFFLFKNAVGVCSVRE